MALPSNEELDRSDNTVPSGEQTLEQESANESNVKEAKPSWKDKAAVATCIFLWGMVLFFGRGALSDLVVDRQEVSACNGIVNSLTPVEEDKSNGLTAFTTSLEEYEAAQQVLASTLDRFPEEFISNFKNEGWRVAFIGELSEAQDNKIDTIIERTAENTGTRLVSFSGLTVPSAKVIFVRYRNSLKAFDSSEFCRVLVHELGHYLQLEKLSEEDLQLWDETYAPMLATQDWTNISPTEAFSIVFAEVVTRNVLTFPDDEREIYHLMNTFVDKYIGEIHK